MEDLVCTNINPTIFMTYIGFNLAVFAFLCQYSTVPKSFISDLSNMVSKGAPRIIDSNNSNISNKPKEFIDDILQFFFELDVIIFTILIYILYSIIAAIVFSLVHYKVIFPDFGNYLVLLPSIIYTVLIIWLVIKVVFNPPTQDIANVIFLRWTKKSRRLYGWMEIILAVSLPVIVYVYLWVLERGLALFLFNIFYLTILFIIYLIPIAYRKPVRNLLFLWYDISEVSQKTNLVAPATQEAPYSQNGAPGNKTMNRPPRKSKRAKRSQA